MTDLQTVMKAIRNVAHRYWANGNHDSNLIGDAFEELANEISKLTEELEK